MKLTLVAVGICAIVVIYSVCSIGALLNLCYNKYIKGKKEVMTNDGTYQCRDYLLRSDCGDCGNGVLPGPASCPEADKNAAPAVKTTKPAL